MEETSVRAEELKLEKISLSETPEIAVTPLDTSSPRTPTSEDAESSSLVEEKNEGDVEDIFNLANDLSSVSLCRKVLPVLDEDNDAACCSICLDDFTEEDPSIATCCGHGYHLQCIMQWAQRSRECPLCFRTLQLEDEDMNSMLPFGEYVNPQQQAATAALLENWELERVLVQLAITEQRERRAARSSRRRSHPGQGGEPSAPRPIFSARGAISDQIEIPTTAGGSTPSSPSASAAGGAPPSTTTPTPSGSAPPSFPASWPPPRGSGGGESASGTGTAHASGGNSHSEGLSQTIKARWASLRLKESFNKTTKGLTSLFGAPSTSRE